MRTFAIALLILAAIFALIIANNKKSMAYDDTLSEDLMNEKPDDFPVATLAGGCFWCVESEFRSMDGVAYTIVGYTGGQLENPTYEAISTGKTGHAEAVEIYYDPDKISYRDLLEHFFLIAHDPTQKDGQGVDKGPQYRSAIFYHNEEQKQTAESYIAELTETKRFKKPIATEVVPAPKFWLAEDYHQQYYEKYKEETGEDHIRVWLKKERKQFQK